MSITDFSEKVTLDVIIQRKKDKLEKIQESQKKISSITKSIIAPSQQTSTIDSIIKYFSMGFAIFDGVKMGIDFSKKIKEYFSKKNK